MEAIIENRDGSMTDEELHEHLNFMLDSLINLSKHVDYLIKENLKYRLQVEQLNKRIYTYRTDIRFLIPKLKELVETSDGNRAVISVNVIPRLFKIEEAQKQKQVTGGDRGW